MIALLYLPCRISLLIYTKSLSTIDRSITALWLFLIYTSAQKSQSPSSSEYARDASVWQNWEITEFCTVTDSSEMFLHFIKRNCEHFELAAHMHFLTGKKAPLDKILTHSRFFPFWLHGRPFHCIRIHDWTCDLQWISRILAPLHLKCSSCLLEIQGWRGRVNGYCCHQQWSTISQFTFNWHMPKYSMWWYRTFHSKSVPLGQVNYTRHDPMRYTCNPAIGPTSKHHCTGDSNQCSSQAVGWADRLTTLRFWQNPAEGDRSIHIIYRYTGMRYVSPPPLRHLAMSPYYMYHRQGYRHDCYLFLPT